MKEFFPRQGSQSSFRTKTVTWSLNTIGALKKAIHVPGTGKHGFHVKLHKLIAERMGLQGQIDHEDTNPLNCQRVNLRLANHSQNQANRNTRKDSLTRVKGVYIRDNGKFMARITVLGERINLGTFDSPEEASAAYYKAAQKHFGEFARS